MPLSRRQLLAITSLTVASAIASDSRGAGAPIKAIAFDVLRHRVAVSYEAEAEEVSSEDVVRRIFEYLPVP